MQMLYWILLISYVIGSCKETMGSGKKAPVIEEAEDENS